MSKRSLSTLIAGIVLVGLGSLFLAVNVYQVDIDWFMAIKLILPALFIWAGALKLWRHFTWTLEELEQRPGKAGLLSGIFWLSLGIVSAMAVFSLLDFLLTAGMYWPVILLLFGMGKIVDFFRMKEISRSNLTEITGVIFIMLFGLGCMKLHQLNVLVLEQDPFWNRIPQILGIEELMDPLVEHSITRDFELDGVTGIEVRNSYGDVTVEGSPSAGGMVSAELTASLREKDEDLARSMLDRVKVEFREENGLLLVNANRGDLKSLGKRINTSIRLRVPVDMRLDVHNEFGGIAVSEMDNDCSLTANKGEIRASFIEGNLQVKSYSEAVSVRGIAGDVDIDAKFSEVDIEDVNGSVSVASSHKPVRAVRVKGNLQVENRHDSVAAEDVSGTVDINNPGGEVGLSRIAGRINVVNSKGDVDISASSGPVNLSAAYGDVRLTDLEGEVEVTASHAGIKGSGLSSGLTVKGRSTEISLENLEGALAIETSQKPVHVSDARGPVDIQNDLGEVVLVLHHNPESDIRIESRQGDIQIKLPSGAAFAVDARVTNGKIVSDFGSAPDQDARGDSVFEALIGLGGPGVNLLTSGSTIEIRRVQ